MTVKACAKLNLILNIKGEREDGYHEIETVFQAIDLCDFVNVAASDKKRDRVVFLPSGKYLPDIEEKDNIALKALKAAKKAFGRKGCFEISIEKNIPPAGGLGGGSADAAAVLTALSSFWQLSEEDREKMYKVAESLGSDVPFCFAAQSGHTAAIGRGRGERLEFIEPVKGSLDLYFSDFHMKTKTAAVYNALIPADYLVQYDIEAFLEAKTLEEKIKCMGNQLQPALERLTGVKSDMILCGAGPTYFRFDKTGEYETLI